jgi:hypothetical protein
VYIDIEKAGIHYVQQLGLPTKLAGLTALAFKLAMMTLPAVFPLTGQPNLHHSIYGSIILYNHSIRRLG